MTSLDILVLLTVGGAGVFGFSRGFVTEVLSLGGWVLAILAVKLFHGPVSSALAVNVGTESGAAVLAFALVFGLSMLVGRLVARRLGDKSKSSSLGSFDRVLGLGFGALKGLIGASLVFMFVSLIYDTIYGGKSERPGWMLESRTYPLLNASSQAIVTFVAERRNEGEGSASATPPAE